MITLNEPTSTKAPPILETIHQSLPTDIKVRDDRHRQKFFRKPLDELIASMQELGQLEPGICIWNEAGELELLVGECRLRACMTLQIPFKYYIKSEIKDPLLLEQIQLDENLCREDLYWTDEVKAKERLHAILVQRHGQAVSGLPGGHRLEDTAEHIGVRKSILHEDVTLASFLEIPEIAAAPNKTTAKKIAKRMIEQVQRREMLDGALKLAKSLPEEKAPLTEQARAELKLKPRVELSSQMSITEKQLIYFSQRCFHSRMEDKLKDFADESFDLIFFDPPWGVDFTANKMASPTTKDYDDAPEDYFTNLPIWLKLLYQKMKPNSHLHMFFGIRNHEFVYSTLEKVGFDVHRIPTIWHKIGAHPIRNPEKWFALSYEPIAYARKGGKKLIQFGKQDVISTPMASPAIKDIHPSAKHPQIYKELLLRCANPGDTILDPMGGSGMLGVAAESLSKTHSLNWFMIEMDEDFRNLQLLNLMKGYEEIAKRETFAPLDIPDTSEIKTFQALSPGTPEWSQWWENHPEDQNAMLAWRKQEGTL